MTRKKFKVSSVFNTLASLYALPKLAYIQPGFIGGVKGLKVFARHLHAGLGVKVGFSKWIGQQLNEYGFVSGVDYEQLEFAKPRYDEGENVQTSEKMAEVGARGQHTNFWLTIHAARELALAENNAQSKQMRNYLMYCSHQYRTEQTTQGVDVDSLALPDQPTQHQPVQQIASQELSAFKLPPPQHSSVHQPLQQKLTLEQQISGAGQQQEGGPLGGLAKTKVPQGNRLLQDAGLQNALSALSALPKHDRVQPGASSVMDFRSQAKLAGHREFNRIMSLMGPEWESTAFEIGEAAEKKKLIELTSG